jgi:hypothetical protein
LIYIYLIYLIDLKGYYLKIRRPKRPTPIYFLKQFANGQYELNYQGVYDAVMDASDENIDAISAILQ